MNITFLMGQKNSMQGFLCVITEKFLAKSEEYLRLCDTAIKSNRPMYVVIKEGTDWEEFKQFPWRTPVSLMKEGIHSPIQYFDDEKEFDKAVKRIKHDLDFFNKTGGT